MPDANPCLQLTQLTTDWFALILPIACNTVKSVADVDWEWCSNTSDAYSLGLSLLVTANTEKVFGNGGGRGIARFPKNKVLCYVRIRQGAGITGRLISELTL